MILIISPTVVIKFGASHRGTFETKKPHQGCKIGSSILTFVHAYLCSDSFFNWTADKILFLYKNIFRICDILSVLHYYYHLNIFQLKQFKVMIFNVLRQFWFTLKKKVRLNFTTFFDRWIWCDVVYSDVYKAAGKWIKRCGTCKSTFDAFPI